MVGIETGRHRDPNIANLQKKRIGCVGRPLPAISSSRFDNDRYQAQHVVIRHSENAVTRRTTPRMKLRRRDTVLSSDTRNRDTVAIAFQNNLSLNMFRPTSPTTRPSHNV